MFSFSYLIKALPNDIGPPLIVALNIFGDTVSVYIRSDNYKFLVRNCLDRQAVKHTYQNDTGHSFLHSSQPYEANITHFHVSLPSSSKNPNKFSYQKLKIFLKEVSNCNGPFSMDNPTQFNYLNRDVRKNVLMEYKKFVETERFSLHNSTFLLSHHNTSLIYEHAKCMLNNGNCNSGMRLLPSPYNKTNEPSNFSSWAINNMFAPLILVGTCIGWLSKRGLFSCYRKKSKESKGVFNSNHFT